MDILFASKILWQHNYREDLQDCINSILKFQQENMQWNLRVGSWDNPLTYVMNDMASPSEDMPKLIDFIEKQLPSWNNDGLIIGYKRYISFLLQAYVKKDSSLGA